MPVATMWQDTYPVKVKGQQTLLGKSCMQCGIGGKIEFLMSGQIPLTEQEEAEVNGLRDDVQKAYDEEQKEANKPWWQKAGEFALDMVPIVGPIVSLAKNASEGNWGMAALDVGFLALDVVGLVATPFTGGASLAATTAAKAGLRATIKASAKAVAKKVSKEAIKAGAKQTAEMLAKLSVKNLTRGKLCVFACFPAGTPVAVKDGYRNIEEIQVGDEVWAWDEASGEVGLKTVVSTLQREVETIIELTIEGETIRTTPEHPFFVDGKWKEAGLLEINDRVQIFTSTNAKVESIQFTGAYSEEEVLQVNDFNEVCYIGSTKNNENTKVYNLEVYGFATYFVGWIKALVHNTKAGVCLTELKNFKWGNYLKSLIGPPPPGMVNPHAHHIVFKKGRGSMVKYLDKSKAILEKHGIDWLKGVENLVWAPNKNHSKQAAKKVSQALEKADKAGGKDAVIKELQRLGKEFADDVIDTLL